VGADLIVAVNSQGIQISGASTISQTGIDALTSLLLQGRNELDFRASIRSWLRH